MPSRVSMTIASADEWTRAARSSGDTSSASCLAMLAFGARSLTRGMELSGRHAGVLAKRRAERPARYNDDDVLIIITRAAMIWLDGHAPHVPMKAGDLHQ